MKDLRLTEDEYNALKTMCISLLENVERDPYSNFYTVSDMLVKEEVALLKKIVDEKF